MKIKILATALFLLTIGFASYYYLTGQSVAQKVAEVSEQLQTKNTSENHEDHMHIAAAGFTPDNLPLALHIQDNDRVVGNPQAPVTVIEYSSMTCPHCANFRTEVYPQIKEAFIDTGKVKWVARALPWDDAAAYISKINRCVPEDQFEAVSTAYLRTQKEWMTAENPLEEVKKIARLAGLTEEQFNACVSDPDLTNEVLAMKRVATEVLNVRGTPAFFINGERIEGGRNFKFMKEALDTAYENATKQKS